MRPLNVANNHYEAMLLLNKPTDRYTEDDMTTSQHHGAVNKPR